VSLFDSALSSASSLTSSAVSGVKDFASSGAGKSLASTALGALGSTGPLAGVATGLLGGVLSSSSAAKKPWGNLSDYMIAQIYACDADGLPLDTELATVMGPITDCNFEAGFNWQSPFENVGPESKAPALMALLQSGQIATVVNALQAAFPSIQNNTIANNAAETAKNIAKDLQGRTGITKMNSRQVFSGMPPIKIPMTMHFRAMQDAEREVMSPLKTLLSWALPQSLAKDGTLTNVIAASSSGASAMVKALFPSRAPLMVAVSYGSQLWAPLVIETITHPLDGPMDSDGHFMYLPVQMMLSTLTALDRNDIPNMYL
jgi:hypothetical protein